MKLSGILFALLVCLTWGVAQEIIPLSQVKPGMIGYGMSVFRGSQIERFNVQVIGIHKGLIPGESVILVRCTPSFGGFDIIKSGIIAGMSGSPIYLEGKLAGALSLGWGFSKEPIAGVTPIESMIQVTKRPLENKMTAMIPKAYHYPALGGLVPVQTPLVASGLTPKAFAMLQKDFEQFGWVPVHGGSGVANDNDQEQTLVPGAPIAAQLMTGDIDLAGIGTTTWVNGNDVLGFGHAFFNAGEISMPIATARISTVIETQVISFKLGYAVQQVGSLVQDRLPAIYGKIGEVCEMLPMTVKIKNKILGLERTFQVKMLRHPNLTPRLAVMALMNFINIQEANFGDFTAAITTRIQLKKEPEAIVWSNLYSNGNLNPENLTAPLQYLYENPFAVIEVANIQVAIEMEHKAREAQISSVQVFPTEVEAGKSLALTIMLNPQYEVPIMMSHVLQLPENVPPGEYVISVVGGGLAMPAVAIPENKEQFIAAIRKFGTYHTNQVVVMMPLPSFKVVCQGKELTGLPPSVVGNLMANSNTKDIQLLPDILTAALDTKYTISGIANILIKVKSPEN